MGPVESHEMHSLVVVSDTSIHNSDSRVLVRSLRLRHFAVGVTFQHNTSAKKAKCIRIWMDPSEG